MFNSSLNQNNEAAGHIFLIEDDVDLSASICEVLRCFDYQIHAFHDPEEFLTGFHDAVPAVVIADVRMPKLSGVELQSELNRRGSKVPVIFISGESTVVQTITAMKQGAIDFITKPFTREVLLGAVAKGIERDRQLMIQVIRQNELQQKLALLSPRERQVFSLMSKGYSNNEMVKELGVALSTVKEYKSEMMYKLRLRSLSELISLSSYATHT
jgi:FixJ family two-component response regulator